MTIIVDAYGLFDLFLSFISSAQFLAEDDTECKRGKEVQEKEAGGCR